MNHVDKLADKALDLRESERELFVQKKGGTNPQAVIILLLILIVILAMISGVSSTMLRNMMYR